MSIVLKPAGGGSKFRFPAMPEKVGTKTSAKYQSFDIISLGTVKVPRGTEVEEVSWDGEFFGISKKDEPIVVKNAWQDPLTCKSIIEGFIKDEAVLTLIITELNLNLDVTVSSFQPKAYGAHGNIKYSISFAQKKPLEIYTTSELQIAQFVRKTTPRAESAAAASGGTYTVASGDTLSGIARSKYGSSGRWTDIYDANSGTIESAAKAHGKASSDHGHWIWPGEVLTIPA